MARQLDSDGSASPVASAAKHWKLLASATVIGGLVGAGVGYALPAEYTAEARLAVGAGSDSAYAIAGFPVAARDLAQNYARWVTDGAQDGTWAQPGVTDISATPIPESGVIRIETTSSNEQAAVDGAAAVSTQLQSKVDELMSAQTPESALEEYRKLAPQVSKAWAGVSVAESAFGRSPSAANAQELSKARATLAEAQLVQDAQGDRYRRMISDPAAVSQLSEIAPAASQGSDRASNLRFASAAGAGIGLVCAFVIAALRDNHRRRTEVRSAAGASATASGPDHV